MGTVVGDSLDNPVPHEPHRLAQLLSRAEYALRRRVATVLDLEGCTVEQWRALTLLALVAVAFLIVVNLAMPLIRNGADGTATVGLLVTLWVVSALLYPRLRQLMSWFVDSVVHARPDYDALRAQLATGAQAHDEAAALLDWACTALAPALSARSVLWRRHDEPAGASHPPPGQAAATVEIPVAEPPG